MAIQQYLAMTGAEISANALLPPKIAWMACHFSPYGTGLSNFPEGLPKSSMLILNDRTPVCGHDPGLIAEQLSHAVGQLHCDSVLLDFQRPNEPETAEITKTILSALTCPVAVTEYYAQNLNCPIFLPPIPPHITPEEYLAPRQSREVWLELALDGTEITVTPEGSKFTHFPSAEASANSYHEPQLHCHYSISEKHKQFRFSLYRTPEDLRSLLKACESRYVTRAIGLYQELRERN